MLDYRLFNLLVVVCFYSHIQYFWEALEAMSSEERSQFINFCSGRSRLPRAASDFPMSFKLIGPPSYADKDPDAYLPIARTCFFSLSLPKYTSLQVWVMGVVVGVLYFNCM